MEGKEKRERNRELIEREREIDRETQREKAVRHGVGDATVI